MGISRSHSVLFGASDHLYAKTRQIFRSCPEHLPHLYQLPVLPFIQVWISCVPSATEFPRKQCHFGPSLPDFNLSKSRNKFPSFCLPQSPTYLNKGTKNFGKRCPGQKCASVHQKMWSSEWKCELQYGKIYLYIICVKNSCNWRTMKTKGFLKWAMFHTDFHNEKKKSTVLK